MRAGQLILLICGLSASGFAASRVTVSLADSRDFCRVVTLPQWRAASLPPDSYPPTWASLVAWFEGSDLEFREINGALLVRLFVLPLPERPERRVYSPNIFEINPTTGLVRTANEGAWLRSTSLPIIRDSSPMPDAASLADPRYAGDRFQFHEEQFRRRGAKWPLQAPSRLSRPAKYLVVNSWSGEKFVEGSNSMVSREGEYFSDIYYSASGRVAFSLNGRFAGLTPGEVFGRSAWIADRYFVFPLDVSRMTKFVLCVAPIANAGGN
jgi:hypothetical protein